MKRALPARSPARNKAIFDAPVRWQALMNGAIQDVEIVVSGPPPRRTMLISARYKTAFSWPGLSPRRPWSSGTPPDVDSGPISRCGLHRIALSEEDLGGAQQPPASTRGDLPSGHAKGRPGRRLDPQMGLASLPLRPAPTTTSPCPRGSVRQQARVRGSHGSGAAEPDPTPRARRRPPRTSHRHSPRTWRSSQSADGTTRAPLD